MISTNNQNEMLTNY